MESLYPNIKTAHLLFVSITIILFNLRFWWRTAKPEQPLHIVLRVLPHINDSLLLFSGMLMMQIVPWQPFGASKWLGIKFAFVIAYIIAGALCLRSQPRSGKWFTWYAVGMICVGIIVYLARFKPVI